MKKFWTVQRITKDGRLYGAVTKQHQTIEEAQKEACRLASENIGQIFLVMTTLYGYKVDLPEPEIIFLEGA